MTTPLESSVQFLPGVGPARAADFARLDVFTVRDLLFTFPRDLSDRSRVSAVADLVDGEPACVLVRPLEAREKRVRGGRMLLTIVHLADETGGMEAVWFNAPWVLEKFQGGEVMLFGKVRIEHGTPRMQHPQYELAGAADGESRTLGMGRIVPLYPCTGKLTQNVWRKVMHHALEAALPHLPEVLPDAIRTARDLPPREAAIRAMHFPETEEERARARERLAFEESLLMQLAILQQRRRIRQGLAGRAFRITPAVDERIRRLFPYRLTHAQERCIAEIREDMISERPMHRLLQGDVGSGKTTVALYAALAAVANGAQVALMAPTAILARQHFDTLAAFLANSPRARVQAALLTGEATAAERKRLLARLKAGAVDILVGTHAAIGETVAFRDLGLAIIDEQHKFGVRQRVSLIRKGLRPDTLVLTATPIPRSLALTLYGDLDVSLLDALPPGRKPVKTYAPAKEKEPEVWRFVRKQLAQGRQAFVISPWVEETADEESRSATEAFESLRAEALRGFRLGLVHGRMKRDGQRAVMDAFRAGDLDALVATVVVEVGVDIPNATVMVVLHAERFGLAQLHQLRGRIGRGAHAGHFVLLAGEGTPAARRRLEALVETADGFRIAEADLRQRGPGEFLGLRQHGLSDLKVVDIVEDFRIIREARREAETILREDPDLRRTPYRPLGEELRRMLAARNSGGKTTSDDDETDTVREIREKETP